MSTPTDSRPEDISDPTSFALYENWETTDLHDAHMETPHLQDFGGRLDDLLDGPLNVHQMRRIA